MELDRQQKKIWRMRTEFWIPNATNTHSKHVTLIAFQRQQWLHERASVLRYTNITCFVISRKTLSIFVMLVSNFIRKPDL
jgi:hypothetical protein